MLEPESRHRVRRFGRIPFAPIFVRQRETELRFAAPGVPALERAQPDDVRAAVQEDAQMQRAQAAIRFFDLPVYAIRIADAERASRRSEIPVHFGIVRAAAPTANVFFGQNAQLKPIRPDRQPVRQAAGDSFFVRHLYVPPRSSLSDTIPASARRNRPGSAGEPAGTRRVRSVRAEFPRLSPLRSRRRSARNRTNRS